MAMEAHRLIALSIKKIAASRGQRGGVSLHKNLLVASVLFKARHVFMAENSSQLYAVAQQASHDNSTTAAAEDEEQLDTDVQCSGQSDHVMEEDMDNNNTEDEQTTAAPSVVAEDKSHEDEAMDVMDSDVEFEDKENSPPSASTKADLTVTVVVATETNKTVDQLSPCAKCTTKRRLTEDGESPSSISSLSSPSSPCKRSRVCLNVSQNESVNTQQQSEPSRHVAAVGSGSEYTKKTDSQRVQQMNSLVHRFNAGLTGFLASSRDNGVQRNKEEGGQCNDKDSQSRGLCANTVSSCSTQIKEAFETLSRPVLALAV